MEQNFKQDTTEKRKIGDTTYIVSSFLRTGKYPNFLDLFNKLLNREIQESQQAK